MPFGAGVGGFGSGTSTSGFNASRCRHAHLQLLTWNAGQNKQPDLLSCFKLSNVIFMPIGHWRRGSLTEHLNLLESEVNCCSPKSNLALDFLPLDLKLRLLLGGCLDLARLVHTIGGRTR